MTFKPKIAKGTTQKNSRTQKRLSKNLMPIRRVSMCGGTGSEPNDSDDALMDETAREPIPSQRQTSDDDREKTNRANQHLQEFVYAVSHDLKMPLRAVNGFSNLLADEYSEQLDDKGKKYIKRIIDGAVHLEQLISCVTEISRICSQKPNFGDIDLNELMEHVIDDLHEVIEETSAVVTWDPLPTVSGDEVQMPQLFRHLLDNGIRFRSETPVKIHVSYNVCEIGHEFKVSDNGIGIDKKDHDRAFTMFQRIGVQDTESAGLGAGLTICRRIVERHGGQIKLESESGFGTQVTFSIPSPTRR